VSSESTEAGLTHAECQLAVSVRLKPDTTITASNSPDPREIVA